MVFGRIMGALNREVKGLHEAAYLLAVFSLLSQVLALLRDRLLAHVFGASASLDIYYAAFRIPDFLFVTVASLFSFSVLVPFLQTALARGEQEARDFMGSVFLVFTALMAISGVIAFVSVPYVVPYLFAGFAGGAEEHTLVVLTRILLLQPMLLGFSGLLASVSQVYHRFLLYAISPVLYNAGIICGILFLYPLWGLYGIGAGVVLGALLHALVQVPFARTRALFGCRFGTIASAHLLRLIMHSLPRTLALSSSQLILLVYAGIASVLGVGALAAFTFAFNLASVPLSIIAASYATAAFPVLAQLHASGDPDGFRKHFVLAARHILFWTLPALTLLVVLRAQVVRVLLGTGAFNWDDTRLVAAALALFSLSLAAQALTLLSMRALYAAHKTRLPFILAGATALFTIALGLWLRDAAAQAGPLWEGMMALLRVSGVPGTAMLALPLAFSIGQLFGAVFILAMLEHTHGPLLRPLAHPLVKNGIAALAAGCIAWFVLHLWGENVSPDTLLAVFAHGTTAGCAGLFVWMLILSTLGSSELADALRVFGRTFWRRAPVAPDEETVL